ncbi:type IV pilus assembly protein PilQ [Mucilaginibacter yixingensis]|uniref:Type IV pilus assembly protein PilQ n=1 Tax=Mucilaginibacter yixingensis TaxID=1295612 RepID=A0A2T5J4M5_9SPHI|nr:general secretion pathway protein GspD [Mucilaginibacter yixingensis]PTQ92458.1 type IV pilus assembly protein PilQ [Mucilaginibacter yixingensis]
MQRLLNRITILFFLLILPFALKAQDDEHINSIKNKLDNLSAAVPGLSQKVQLNLNNVTISEYLGALGKASNLSLSIDSRLTFKVNHNFNDVTAEDILIFLAKQYSLDIEPVGSIIMIAPYIDPKTLVKPTPRELSIKYNQLENTLSFELNNDSLLLVARKIAQLSGKNVVVPNALQGKKVTSYMNSAPFETALDKMAYANELKMVKTSDNYYLFQTLGEGEELYVNGDKSTGVRKNFKLATPTTGGANINLFSKVVGGQKLLSAEAVNAPIADLVKMASQEMNKNYFLYSELKGNITVHISDISYDNFLSALFKGTDYTFIADNGIYMIGDRKLEGLRTSRAIKLENRPIDTVMAIIPNDWKKSVEIREFREQNTILLSGSRPQIAEIESFIKQVDLLVPMVLIEVNMIDIHKTRTVSTGIAAGVSDSVKTGGSILPGINYTFGASSINDFLSRISGSTGFNLGHVVPNFYVSLKALENNDNVDVRAVPKLATLNGHSAKLSIGQKRYYQIKTQNVIPSITSPTSIFTDQYKEVEANMDINIKPIVSGDDQVTLNIKVNISDFIGTPPDNAPPPTANSVYESIVRAHNEDMIVLGGIERNETDDSTSGVPVLSRIPILKWIFSNKTKTNQKVVTVLFIKPTIIR